ncbi:hypothetical protein BH09SUM1_BH09SUM1_26270 [soil metagenome]
MRHLARFLLCPVLLTAGLGNAQISPDTSAPSYWWVTTEGEPSAKIWKEQFDIGNKSGAAKSAGEAAKESKAKRALIRAEITKKLSGKAKIIFESGKLLSGMAVECNDPATLRSIPGVVSIMAMQPQTPDLSTSVPFIHAPQVWEAANAIGDGVRIGIIDTGIDYLHTDFGGPGTGYETNDHAVLGDSPAFPGPRVVGGTDLAGDSYNAGSSSTSTPAPDPDPVDCQGHGSHVAGITGGSGVNSDGTTYAGPYNTTIPFSSFRIGPGVAPRASLLSIKVFGCTGSTLLVAQGFEYAADPNDDNDFSDHLDVVNVSIGSNYSVAESPEGMAADVLASLGTVVVCSAGNSGDTTSIIGGASVAKRSISVASSMDNGLLLGEVVVNPGNIVYDAGLGELTQPTTTGVTGTIQNFQSNSALCSGISTMTGQIAVIRMGGCGINTKSANAQNAGAIGVVFTETAGTIPEPVYISSTTITIPYAIISKADGDALTALRTADANLQVTIRAKTGTPKTFGDTMSNFTSRGPGMSVEGINLKPDISAPGNSISSAKNATGNSGTPKTPA